MSDRLDQRGPLRVRRWIQLGVLAGAAAVLGTPAVEAQGRGEKKDAAAAVPSDNSLRLEVGTQQVLPADNVRSYSEGVQGVIDVRLTGDAKSFVIVALRPGNTTLLFIMMDGSERLYKINVFDPNATKPIEKKLGPPREQVLTRPSNSSANSHGRRPLDERGARATPQPGDCPALAPP